MLNLLISLIIASNPLYIGVFSVSTSTSPFIGVQTITNDSTLSLASYNSPFINSLYLTNFLDNSIFSVEFIIFQNLTLFRFYTPVDSPHLYIPFGFTLSLSYAEKIHHIYIATGPFLKNLIIKNHDTKLSANTFSGGISANLYITTKKWLAWNTSLQLEILSTDKAEQKILPTIVISHRILLHIPL